MPELLSSTDRFQEEQGGFQDFLVLGEIEFLNEDGEIVTYEFGIPFTTWNSLNPSEMMKRIYWRPTEDIVSLDTEGNPVTKKPSWELASNQELADVGMDAGQLRHEIIYNTMRRELLNRGVDPLVLNMPEVEKFIVDQSVTQKPGIQSDYIDVLAGKLGQVSQSPIEGKTILKEFGEQLKVDEEENKRIIGEQLSGFENPRNLEETKQFAEEKSRRIQELVANGFMSPADAVTYQNDIEREFEKQNAKFQGISRQMEVGRQGGMALQNYFTGQTARQAGETEKDFRQRRATFFGEAVTPEFRSQILSGQYDPRTVGDLGQQMQYIAYQTEQRELSRIGEIEGGAQEEPYEAPLVPEPLVPVSPFKILVKEAQKNKQRRISI